MSIILVGLLYFVQPVAHKNYFFPAFVRNGLGDEGFSMVYTAPLLLWIAKVLHQSTPVCLRDYRLQLARRKLSMHLLLLREQEEKIDYL